MMDSRYLFEETVTAIMTGNLHRLARNQQAEALQRRQISAFDLAMKHMDEPPPQPNLSRVSELQVKRSGMTIAVSVPSLSLRPLFVSGPGRVERGPTSEKSGKETYRSPKGNVYPRPRASFGRGRR
jgi:hypothetical protein